MPNLNSPAPEQVVEIVVSGDLTLPSVPTSDLAGRSIVLTIDAATIVGYSAQLGSAQTRGTRPSQRQGKDHVRIQIDASSLTIADAPPPGPPEG